MNKFFPAILALALSFSLSSLAGARPPEAYTEQPSSKELLRDVLFSEAERRILGDYINRCRDRYDEDRCWESEANENAGKKPKKLPPGLQKKLERGGELPPGWQKKVARGEVIDSDFYRTYSRSLPEEILRRLPRDIDGTSIRRIDDRIVRIQDNTRLVLDVLDAVTR